MRKLVLLALCISMAIGQVWSQATRTVTGKVTDDQGNPLAAAVVQAKGNGKIGTTTATDGTFKLSVPQNVTTLVISSIGYNPMEISIANQTSVTARLVSNGGNNLDEVVVTVPYGTVKKTAFTGSENTITAKQIEKQQVTSVTKALEGLAPGIMATNGGGAPGSNASIVLRGFSSVTQGSDPLYVLNGVPYDGSLSALSPEDIESVTLLKDATASALYGSRAAGGVIMIQTKTGKKGRPSVNAKITQGVLTRGIPEYDRLAPKEYYEMMWEATRNSFVYGSTPVSPAQAGILASQQLTDASHLVYNAYNVPGATLVDPVTGKLNGNAQLLWNESWEDALFRAANRTNASLSISGANDKTNYYISGGYLNEQGIMRNTDYKRYNFRMSVNTAATNWLNAGFTMDGAYYDRNDVINGGTATSNPFYYTREMGPIYPVYRHNLTTGAFIDSAGQHLLDWGIPGQMGARPYAANSNLLGTLQLDKRQAHVFNGNAQPYVEIKFLKDFSLKSNLGVTLTENNGLSYQNSQYGDAANVLGRGTVSATRVFSFTINQLLNWNHQFGNHTVRALAGHESYKYRSSQVSATKTGYAFPGFTELDNAGTTEGTPSSSTDVQTIESYFGQVNYEYQNRYLLNVNYRRDGTSRFAPDVRWGNFYSAGAGWRISRENFMKNITWVNDLKLRTSYGQVGNQSIANFYNYTDWFYANGLGQYNNSTLNANPELQWETSIKFNVGADFTLFKNRLQGTIEYFRNTNKNLLMLVTYAISPGGASGGYQNIYRNIGGSRNTGIEIQLGYNAVRRRNFDWRIDVNFSHIKNVVTGTYPAAEKTGGFISGTKKISTGFDQFSFWLREYAGVDAATGEALWYRDVLDANGKATGERALTSNINNASFYRMGSAIPKFNGGLTNSFRYRNFDLSVLLTFAYGGKFYDGNYASIMHSGSYGIAWSTDILNRWQRPGDITNVPKVQNGVANQDGVSSRYLFDASYLNIKNITLSYTLPASTAKRLHVAGLQVFGNVDNAYLFTAKKGMDPQRDFSGTSNATYPPFRTVSFGLNVNLQ
jgi:TonB-linked SusC/RagA family outer membrane protein